MSNRHYWPEPPKEGGVVHLVEHKSGSRTWWNLLPDGEWVDSETGELRDNAWMESQGFFGVRTPFDVEAERAAFENHMKGCDFARDEDDESLYANLCIQELFDTWLAAKRQERGL